MILLLILYGVTLSVLKSLKKPWHCLAELWHTREVDAEPDLNTASRETLLEIIA